MDNVSVKVRKVLTDLGYDYSEISDDDKLTEDIGMDSIELLNFAMELETEFDIEIPDSAVTANMTVGQVTDKIKELTANAPTL